MGDIKQYEPLWGSWAVDATLGEGSFGKVYRVKREEFGRTYYSAVKIISLPQSAGEVTRMKSEGLDDASVKSYFQSLVSDIIQEIEVMNALKGNSNIVSFEDYKVIERTDGFGWDILIRMELLTSLTERTADNPLSQDEAIKLGIHICRALELCAVKNILHRDIKPDNIFVSEYGEYKLGDFGVARQAERTMSGMSKKGTYTYMAPEVYKGERYGASADIYSLGIVLYRLLNKNRAPFLPDFPAAVTPSDRDKALERRMGGDKLPPLKDVSSELGAVVLKACAFNRDERYSTAAELRQALNGIEAKTSDGTAPTANLFASIPVPRETTEATEGVFSSRPAPELEERTSMTAGVFSDAAPVQAKTEATVSEPIPKKSRKGLMAAIICACGIIVIAVALFVSGVLGNKPPSDEIVNTTNTNSPTPLPSGITASQLAFAKIAVRNMDVNAIIAAAPGGLQAELLALITQLLNDGTITEADSKNPVAVYQLLGVINDKLPENERLVGVREFTDLVESGVAGLTVKPSDIFDFGSFDALKDATGLPDSFITNGDALEALIIGIEPDNWSKAAGETGFNSDEYAKNCAVELGLTDGIIGFDYDKFITKEEAEKIVGNAKMIFGAGTSNYNAPVQAVEPNVINVGGTVSFGEYEWIVLDKTADKALLITKDIIDFRVYDEDSSKPVTWENSGIRYYLNGEFFYSFSPDDIEKICKSTISNPDNPWYGTSGGNDTEDYIFLISIDDVVRYFGDSGQLSQWNGKDWSISDDGFRQNRVAYYDGEPRAWWLRTPGEYGKSGVGYTVAKILDNGDLYITGDRVSRGFRNGRQYTDAIGVRPALWISLSDESVAKTANGEPELESITITIPKSDGLRLTLTGCEGEYSMQAPSEYSTFDVYYFYLRETGTFSFNSDVTVSHGNEAEANIKAGEKVSVVSVVSDETNRRESGGYGFINDTKTVIIRIEPDTEYRTAKASDYLVWHQLSDLR